MTSPLEWQAITALRNAFNRGVVHTGDPMGKEIIFVTGKGGVGKSTVAAAIALQKSRSGQSTLLVEIGDQSFYKDYFNLPKVGYEPQKLRENLSVALWTGQDCLREYILHLIKVEALYKLFFENAVMKAFVNVAPALPELAIMGKATSGPRNHGPKLPYDCIVIDAYATGHFLALMGAAKGMAEAVKVGPMGEQSRSIDKVLRDPNLCQYYIVSLPEELPVRETEELVEKLKSDYGVKANVIVNKGIEKPFSAAEFKAAVSSNQAEFQEFAEEQKTAQEAQLAMQKRLEQVSGKIRVFPHIWSHDVDTILDQLVKRLS